MKSRKKPILADMFSHFDFSFFDNAYTPPPIHVKKITGPWSSEAFESDVYAQMQYESDLRRAYKNQMTLPTIPLINFCHKGFVKIESGDEKGHTNGAHILKKMVRLINQSSDQESAEHFSLNRQELKELILTAIAKTAAKYPSDNHKPAFNSNPYLAIYINCSTDHQKENTPWFYLRGKELKPSVDYNVKIESKDDLQQTIEKIQQVLNTYHDQHDKMNNSLGGFFKLSLRHYKEEAKQLQHLIQNAQNENQLKNAIYAALNALYRKPFKPKSQYNQALLTSLKLTDQYIAFKNMNHLEEKPIGLKKM